MKTIFLITFFLGITLTFAWAEIQVPDSVREEAKQLHLENRLDDKAVKSILANFTNQKIIKNTHSVQQIYKIPSTGET